MRCACYNVLSLLPCKHHVLYCCRWRGVAARVKWLVVTDDPSPHHHHSPWHRALTFPDRSDTGPRWKWSLSLAVFSASLRVHVAYSVITSKDNFFYIFSVLATSLDTYTYKIMRCHFLFCCEFGSPGTEPVTSWTENCDELLREQSKNIIA